MALDFPNSPSNGDEWYDAGSKVTYVYQASINAWYPKTNFPKSTVEEIQAGSNDVKFPTPKGLKDAGMWPVGFNQTWQNVVGSRANATNYTNSTGQPIAVSIGIQQISTATVSFVSTLKVGGVTVATGGLYSNAHSNEQVANHQLFAIVPAGAVYRLDLLAGATLQTWAELRT